MLISDSSASLNRRTKRSGFSILEMVVTLGIIAVLSGIMIGYSRSAARSLTLAAKESEVIGVLVHAKSLSQSFVSTRPSGELICAYGLHVDTLNKELTVFQDRVLDTVDCSASDNVYTSGEELSGETKRVGLGDEFSFISSTDPSSPDLIDVIFIPPDPEVLINNNATATSASIIVRSNADTNLSFTIKVSNFGQIERE